jgi:hypothetical protein
MNKVCVVCTGVRRLSFNPENVFLVMQDSKTGKESGGDSCMRVFARQDGRARRASTTNGIRFYGSIRRIETNTESTVSTDCSQDVAHHHLKHIIVAICYTFKIISTIIIEMVNFKQLAFIMMLHTAQSTL